MTISSAINAARSGLQITGLRADIVANNVANATTPGYVRRSVNIAENIVAGQTSGVRSTGIGRTEDARLTAERRLASSDLSQASVMASAWRSISSRLGDTADGTGLFAAFSDFESALRNAALSPESATEAASVLDGAKAIVRELNDLSTLAERLRGEADQSINDGVAVVNQALKQIETLNTKIARAPDGSAHEAALLDERQRVLDTIGEYMPIQTVERSSGAIEVLSREGVYLVTTSGAQQIEFSPSRAFGPSETLESGALSGLMVGDTDITPGTATFGAVSSGMFGALFTMRDSDVPNFSAQLDTIAGDMMGRLSAAGVDPTTADGEPGLFIDPADSTSPGLAGRIAVNPLVDPQQGGTTTRLRDGLGATMVGPTGDATILNNLLGAFTDLRAIDENGIQGTFSSTDMVAQLASLSGQARVHHDSVLTAATQQHSMLKEATQDISGVDVDAQMQDLLLIEQAYAANARIIEVASQMINRLMEL